MITAIEPKVCATGRYSFEATAQLLGIHVNTLRNYTRSGYISCSYRRTPSRNRFYYGREILRFWKSYL